MKNQSHIEYIILMKRFFAKTLESGSKVEKINRQNGWILVNKRLPHEQETILVTVKHSIQISDWGDGRVVETAQFEKYGTYVGRYKKGSWWWLDEEKNRAKKRDTVDTVIAWQPFPEPYKGE